jgi:leucyl aminopeptidase
MPTQTQLTVINCFASVTSSGTSTDSTPIIPLSSSQLPNWLVSQNSFVQQWFAATKFCAEPNSLCLVPTNQGDLSMVVVGIVDEDDLWPIGMLPYSLPNGTYHISHPSEKVVSQAILAWGLGAYRFQRYKQLTKPSARLVIPASENMEMLQQIIAATYLVRDLVNTPTEDMHPENLADVTINLADRFGAKINQIIGDALLQQNYPAIHAVGRASLHAPRLLDLRWGDQNHRKLTLVGKGVCFDTGGLDLKSSNGMVLMKKDMGGAAHVLGLAQVIMALKLPVCLRVLIPAVENVIAGNAYLPGDIIATRKGLSVEIGNTDAEGRVILADALTEAASEQPDLIIDFATLTGAARVALGPDLAALFCNDDAMAAHIQRLSAREQDPIWRLPLYKPYRDFLNSPIADINNNSVSPYAGAITAALFLQDFIAETPWMHLDIMAWNIADRPGKPQGGEALGLRAVLAYIIERYR